MRLSILLSVALLGSVTGRTTADAMTRLTALKSEALKDQANVEQDLEEKVLSERKAEEESQAQTLAKVFLPCRLHFRARLTSPTFNRATGLCFPLGAGARYPSRDAQVDSRDHRQKSPFGQSSTTGQPLV